jgi:hypothetical protein
MFADNGPAILAEVTGGSLQVDRAALASIDKPTLLVAAASSPEAFRQATDAMATAMRNSRKYTVEGGHLINPADPAVLDFLEELVRQPPQARVGLSASITKRVGSGWAATRTLRSRSCSLVLVPGT